MGREKIIIICSKVIVVVIIWIILGIKFYLAMGIGWSIRRIVTYRVKIIIKILVNILNNNWINSKIITNKISLKINKLPKCIRIQGFKTIILEKEREITLINQANNNMKLLLLMFIGNWKKITGAENPVPIMPRNKIKTV